MTYEEARRLTDGWEGDVDVAAEVLAIVNAAVLTERRGGLSVDVESLDVAPKELYALVDEDTGEVVDFMTVEMGPAGRGFVRVKYVRADLRPPGPD